MLAFLRKPNPRQPSLTAGHSKRTYPMRKPVFVALLAALAVGSAQSAAAQAPYPNKLITVIVPFAAGGPTDVVTRLVGEHMSRTLGQQLVVENVGGAGGSTGMTRAAQATPDGYTIAVGNMGTQSAAPALYPNLKYDPATSFEQVGVVNFTPQAIVAKKDTAAGDLKAFIDYLQANHEKLSYGHAGVGSISHVSGTLFNAKFGLKPGLVAYRGTAPALNDLVGGQIDYMVDQSLNVIPQIKAGTIKVYAVAAPDAARKHSARADHQGARRRFHLQRLERHGGAQGHAQGDRRQARRRARQGAGRCHHSRALRGARQHRPAGRRSRPGRTAEAGRERDGAHHAGAQRGCRGRKIRSPCGLTEEERAMLAGEQGPVRQWAVRHQIAVGEFFDAPDFVPVGQAHVMADTESLGEAGVAWLEGLAAATTAHRRVRIPTITDPRGLDFASYKRLKQTDAMAAIEARAIAAFEALGVLMTNTCINYQTILPPVRGEHLALGDTGVVIYSNSVMGARSNFEGGPSALAAGLTGRTPRYGYHLERIAPAPCISTCSISRRTSRIGARWAASSAALPTATGRCRSSPAFAPSPAPISSSISGRRWRASARWRCSTCPA